MEGKYRVEKGTITGISGQAMSGLWMLHLDSGNVHIESGCGVRNLASAFGATEGSGDLQEKIEGKEIFYSTDAFNVLEGFTPVEDASPELVEQFESQGDD
ncbi:hypothetical protein CMI37_22345 [Candidatus Pacearchaeota archaeon]|nr:hypothetical protein [Candidatus Pacearchaeota archaeon]|tara:strand:+ start:2700 stop:2999 length:300 start_codon:yes stop_codon:yes gene_type:complete